MILILQECRKICVRRIHIIIYYVFYYLLKLFKLNVVCNIIILHD